MSLLVWLPLVRDLIQQGLDDLTVTNNGVTLDNNGKLGKCYHFDGNAHYLQFSKSVGDLYSGDFSYAVWLKPTDDTRSIICSEYAASGASGIAFELTASRGIRLYWNGSPDIYPTNCTLPKNEWSHVAITRSGNEAKFYINGELRYTYTGTLSNKTTTAKIRLGDDYRGGNSVSYQGYMNDFRLYNHCLSEKEVKELAKGLVAHYSLEGKKGFDNLLSNTGNLTKWSKESGVTVSWDSEKNMYKISDSAHTSSRWGIYQDLNITADTTYTITCTLDGNSCGVGFGFYDSSISAFPSPVMSTSGTKIKQSYTITSGASSTKCRIYLYTNCATSTVAWFSLPKLEVSSVATTWIPKSTDDEYNIMGYNNTTTEYDMSGYNYHGAKNKTMNIITDTAKYSVATIFDGSTDSIQIPFYEMLGSNTSATYSFSVWIYKTEIGSKSYQTILGGPSGFEFEARKQAETNPVIQLYSWGGGTAAYEFNKWNHIVFSRTSSGSKLYLNGELVISNGSAGTIPSGNYFIGSWRDTSSQNFQGRMSDFRIYASELTADQVKELYQSASSIDKNGNLFGYEFVEV